MPTESTITSASVRPLRLPRALTWSIVFLAYTAIAVLLTGYRYLDDLSRQRTGTFAMRTLEEVTGVYSFFLLLPFMLRVANAYLFPRKSWPRLIIWHLGAAIAFSAAHTLLMSLSRQLIAPLIGLGPYDYGIMLYRYPMEFSNDLVGYTSIIGLYYFFQRYRLAQAQQLAAAELETKLAQAQLENLRLQLQPHFLFNTLNTVSSLIRFDPDMARGVVLKLSNILRRLLRKHETFVPLREELDFIDDYLDIEVIRFGRDKLQIFKEIEAEALDSFVPSMLLQPMVENSLKHGLDPRLEGGQIHIRTRRNDGRLYIEIEDNGVGISSERLAEVYGGGIGISNVHERLRLLYGDQFKMDIRSEEGQGTQIHIEIPELITTEHVLG